MRSLWVASHAYSNTNAGTVAHYIGTYLCTVIEEIGEIEHPFGIDAAEVHLNLLAVYFSLTD